MATSRVLRSSVVWEAVEGKWEDYVGIGQIPAAVHRREWVRISKQLLLIFGTDNFYVLYTIYLRATKCVFQDDPVAFLQV